MHTAFFLTLLGCGTVSTAEPTGKPESTTQAEPSPEVQPTAEVAPAAESRVALMGAEAIRSAMQEPSGHVRVFNFWATWCRPCIAELPHLAALQAEYEDIEVLLVSLDHRSIGAPRVKSFLEKRGHSLQSFMLDAEDPADEMLQLYPEFPGAIPITLVFDGDGDLSKAFHHAVSLEDLRGAVDAAR